MGDMKQELQLKLQAYLDGELPDGEAREMANYAARDADARDLLTELKHTRAAVADYEADIKLPESREFYWSKIRREIQRLENVEPAAKPPSLLLSLRRLLVPAGALAVLAIGVLITSQQLSSPKVLGALETETAQAEVFTYRDYDSGTTLVWLSYPAENSLADFSPTDTYQ